MARFKKGWSDQDHAEFDALVAEVQALDVSTAERGERFMLLIDDAVQAQRMWARDVERSSRLAGFKAIWYRIQRRGSKLVLIGGREVDKPAQISVKREDASGKQFRQLAFFDDIDLADVADKRREFTTMRNSYNDNILMLNKVEMFIKHAGARTVREAEDTTGMTLDTWLARKAA